ncbi:hypothetical protein JXJ21_07930 [candidate division KSB1 bacterium]|nr:hypothetical protein [candidate division KSB1 bacterium]
MIRYIAVALFFSFMVILSCWKKQSHEVIAPETPTYTLSGTITDIDSEQFLMNVQIKLQPYELLFDWTLPETLAISDSAGLYQFKVCPGNYWLHAERENYPVLEKKVTVNYEDRLLDLELPDWLVTSEALKFQAIHGICFVTGDTLAIGSTWIVDRETSREVHRIYIGTPGTNFSVLGSFSFATENPEFHGLEYINRKFYSFIGDISNPEVGIFESGMGKIERRIAVGHRFTDFAFDGSDVWASAGNAKIYRLDKTTLKALAEFDSPASYPVGIAWYGKHICSCDGYLNRLYIHDEQLAPLKTYRPFFSPAPGEIVPLTALSYLTAAKTGQLYLVNANAIYIFDL